MWDKGEKGNIKQCLKIKRIEILNSDLFCLILFTSLFKEASQKIESFRTFLIAFFLLYNKIQRPL